MIGFRRRRALLEEEADERARRLVLRGRAETDPRPLRRAPTAGSSVADDTVVGEPLQEELRAELEAALDVDLTRVRVRPRDERVRRRGAAAESRGALVSFAPGRFAPHTLVGRRLLAHEVAHVVQGRPGAPARTASKKDTDAKPFHQEILDAGRKARGRLALALQPIIALFAAVDDERATQVPSLVAALDKVDTHVLPPGFPSSSAIDELMARVVLLGQAPSAAKIRTWYLALPDVSAFPKRGAGPRRYYDHEEWHWQSVLERLRAKVSWTDGWASLRVIDGLVAFCTLLARERSTLDPTLVKEDRARVVELVTSLGGLGVGFESKPYLSIARYDSSLVGLQRDAFVGMQAAFQAALEQATEHIALRRDRRLLDALERRLDAVLRRLTVPGPRPELEINEWEWRKRGRKDVLRQVDFFPDDKKAAKREITLESYDKESVGLYVGPTKEIDYRRIVEIRTNQVRAVKRIYGLDTGSPDRQVAAEAKENLRALSATGAGALRLHSDEDWRRFLLAKFDAHLARTRSADQSLLAVMDLLRVYLRSFTTHSPMNIEDFGDDLLRVQFPRALTGQLVHDCGVYALRITYMLSLLREHPALRLRFRFIQLPVHIGLIITGAPGLTTWVVHNDDFHKASEDDMNEYRARWEAVDATGRPLPQPLGRPATKGVAKAREDQFLGELAANELVEGTVAPFVISDVPVLRGKSERVDKDQLSAFYRSLARVNLFGPVTQDEKSPYYQFHLRYLELLDRTRVHHNTFLVPYWNVVGHGAWNRSSDQLRAAYDALSAATNPTAKRKAGEQFARARTRYLATDIGGHTIPSGLTRVVKAFVPIQELAHDINEAVKAKPQLIPRGISRASAARVAHALDSTEPWWHELVERHLSDLRAATLNDPPFATRSDLLSVVD
jgi:hypothetical protein